MRLRLGVLLLLGLFLACSRTHREKEVPAHQSVLQQLQNSQQFARVTKARISNFPHAGYQNAAFPNSARKEIPEVPLPRLATWRAPFEREPGDGWSHEVYRGKAITELLLEPEHSGLENAMVFLKQALETHSENADYYNDLGVAQYTYGIENQQALSLIKALTQFEKALSITRQHSAAGFNKALVLESLGLFERAKEVWQVVIANESDDAWRAEAQTRLGELVQTNAAKVNVLQELAQNLGNETAFENVVNQSRTQSWRAIEREWLPAWGSGTLSDLAVPKAVARSLAKLTQDQLYLASFEAIEQAQGTALEALRQGHRFFLTGVQALESDDRERAYEDLTASYNWLSQASSPFKYRVQYYLALLENLNGSGSEAIQMLTDIIEVSREAGFLNLLGEALWVKGQCEVALLMPDRALATYRSARPVFEQLGGVDNLCGIHYKIASTLIYLGELEKGWAHLIEALGMLAEVSKPMRVFQVYMLAVDGALRAGEPEVAGLYQRAAARWAATTESLWAQSTAALWGARIDALCGREELADQKLEQASNWIANFQGSTLGNQMEADRLAVWGERMLLPQPLEGALERLEVQNNLVNKASLLCSLAKAYRREQRPEAAIASLEKSLAIYESYRPGLSDELRTRLFSNIRHIFDEMISLQLSLGNYQVALDYAEAKRARLYLEQAARAANMAIDEGNPKTTKRLQALLNDQTLLIFATVDDGLVVWILSASGLRYRTITSDLTALEQDVNSFRQLMERRAPLGLIEAKAERLYRLLLAPLEDVLPAGKQMVIVPDGPLHNLPFSALKHPSKGFLMTFQSLVIAASANAYAKSLVLGDLQHQKHDQKPPRLLLFGNPAFDQREFPQLSPLTLDEVNGLKKLYGQAATTVVGSAATRQAFLEQAASASMLHFNGHALINRQFWPRSKLIMAASDNQEASYLSAAELSELNLANTRLVILSACATGVSSSQHDEGLANLARPFLTAGVPAVIASMWDVEDRITAKFMLLFHQYLLLGMPSGKALRVAAYELQNHSSGSKVHPADWAAFQLFGASNQVFFNAR